MTFNFSNFTQKVIYTNHETITEQIKPNRQGRVSNIRSIGHGPVSMSDKVREDFHRDI